MFVSGQGVFVHLFVNIASRYKRNPSRERKIVKRLFYLFILLLLFISLTQKIFISVGSGNKWQTAGLAISFKYLLLKYKIK